MKNLIFSGMIKRILQTKGNMVYRLKRRKRYFLMSARLNSKTRIILKLKIVFSCLV